MEHQAIILGGIKLPYMGSVKLQQSNAKSSLTQQVLLADGLD